MFVDGLEVGGLTYVLDPAMKKPARETHKEEAEEEEEKHHRQHDDEERHNHHRGHHDEEEEISVRVRMKEEE